jgi:hypothetical protein
MVFCASFEPWLKAITEAEKSCARRKRRFSGPGCAFRKIQSSASMIETPMPNPRSGASTVGISTLCRMPFHLTASAPAIARTAPAVPPVRQCDEREGSAHHQVRRFQAMAPISPPSITGEVTAVASTMPPARVAATCVEIMAPTTFSTAAPASATFGGTAPVEMQVATALAAS